MIELDEVRTMLAQRVQQWKQQWRDDGFAEGMEQGVAEGLKSERLMLVRLSRLRFGALIAAALAPQRSFKFNPFSWLKAHSKQKLC